MADDLPSADEFFAPAQQQQPPPSLLQSAELFFAPKGSYSGQAHDDIWGNPAGAGARILNAFGYGAEYGWGSEPVGLSQDAEAGLRKAGVFNDYVKGNTSLFKTANEAIIRPAVDLADIAARAIRTPFYSLGAGAEQAAQEIKGQAPTPVSEALATPFGGVGEISGSIPEGFIPELPSALHAADAARARSVGVIGEGDAGYYDAQPLTPEAARARAQAAEPGAEVPPTRPPAQDVHDLARRIDPETFEKFDQLSMALDVAGKETAGLPEGRSLDTLPIIDRDAIQRLADTADLRAQDADIAKQLEALPEGDPDAADRLNRLETVERNLKAEDVTPEERRTLSQRRDELLTDTTPEKLREAAAPIEQRRALEAQKASVADQLARLQNEVLAEPSETAAAVIDAKMQLKELQPKVEAVLQRAREMAPDLPEQARVEPEAGTAREGDEEKTAEVPAGQAVAEPAKGQAQVPEAEPVEGTPAKETRPRGSQLRAVQGTGEFKTRGLAQGVEAKAIEDGLTANFGDLPEYRQLSMAEQAEAAKKLIDTDYETAKAIAMGRKQPPKGLLPESVFVGVEKRALAEGDVETMRQLATQSRLSTEATTMGQRIRTLGERDPTSPVGAIAEVQKAREAALARKVPNIEQAKQAAVEEMKAEVRRAAPSQKSWSEFLDELKCEA